jgi:hypothetical protein
MNDIKFKNKWNLWYHNEKDNWTISGYKKIYTIESIYDFWKLYNNWNQLGGLTSKHFFIMKEDIPPIWEDSNNINGGCWSFKINEDQSYNLFEDLSTHLVCESIIIKSDEIMGISICLKKNNNVIIKIWNNNSNNNSLKLINDTILKKWGLDIIYISHITDN